jgi:hypothetical protein
MKTANSLSKTNKHLRDVKKRTTIATRFSLSSSGVEGIKPSPKLKKELEVVFHRNNKR